MPKYFKDKEELFKHFSEKYDTPNKSFKNKLNRYDAIWDRAELIADVIFKGSTNISKGQIVQNLVKESFEYKGSVVSSFRNLKGKTLEQNVERAIRLSTVRRLDEFIKKYSFTKSGKETKRYKYKIFGQKLTLEQWSKQYLQNKISTDQFLKIIDFYQTKIPKYDAKNYRKSDNSDATLRKYGFNK